MDNNSYEDQYDVHNPNGLWAGLLLLAWLLLGGLAGAGAMLLLALQSGKKTREQIRRKGWDLREQATEYIEGGVNQVRTNATSQVTTSMLDQAEDLQQRGQDVVDQQKERWSPVVEAGKTAVQGP